MRKSRPDYARQVKIDLATESMSHETKESGSRLSCLIMIALIYLISVTVTQAQLDKSFKNSQTLRVNNS
jgi:hypothetical protein